MSGLSTKPAKLIYDDAAHAYYVDGKRWSGASNYGGQIENQSALINWGKRQAAKGVALDDKLRQQILLHLDDDAKLDRLAEQALTAAGANATRDRGSEIHRITEQHDKGALLLLTDDMRDIVTRWQDILAAHDITLDADYVERIVVAPEFKVCGTFDRLAVHRGRRVVLDLKTGKPTKYRHTMCVQLALLANAEWITHSGYTHGEKTTFTQFDPMPEVDTEVGLIVSMPSDGSPPAVYELPLAEGLRAARLAKEAKEWTSKTIGVVLSVSVASARDDSCGTDAAPSRTAQLGHTSGAASAGQSTTSAPSPAECAASTATPPPTSSPTSNGQESQHATTSPIVDDDATRAWLSARLAQVKANPKAYQDTLSTWIGSDIPSWDQCTADDYEAVEGLLDLAERIYELPFIPRPQAPHADIPEPVAHTVPDEGATLGKDAYETFRLELLAEEPNVRAQFFAWVDEMGKASKPLNLGQQTTERRMMIAQALRLWAKVGDDELLRAALALVLGDDAVQPAFTTGKIVATLSTAEADAVARVASSLDGGRVAADYSAGVCRLKEVA